jgi:MFS family permease
VSVPVVSREQLHAPFRSRRGRVIGWFGAGGVSAAMLFTAVILPWSGPSAVGWPDRAGFVALAVLFFWGLSRFALVGADPSEARLVVRNLLVSRRLDWTEVTGIRYGTGDPWVSLELSDGDTLAVMAIQRADGATAAAEAKRLATLIALHRPR